MKDEKKVIDYLSEDVEMPSQKYALISIVGPNMNQKCDVWGLKVRGVTESLESAKALTAKIMKMDNDFDIYTVSVGKFFPLAVEPYDVQNVEYENEQLNNLVKKYMENKESANEHWHQRKSEMMKDALREGKAEGQLELAKKQEHPVSVLQRIQVTERKMKEINDQLSECAVELEMTRKKYDSYTDEEKQVATTELNSTTTKVEKVNNVNEYINGNFKSGAHDSLFV